VFLILSVDSLNRNASISRYDSIVWTTTGGLLWVRAISLLKTTFLPFSIFVSGFVRVFMILIPFMITTLCLMTGLALMFFTRINTILETSMLCGNPMQNDAFCSLGGSWVETFHMMFGLENQYSEFVIENNRVLFSLFSFVVGIVFIYIVIAIVNESFGTVISAGHRAFWINRLELVTKTDTLHEFWFGPLKSDDHSSFPKPSSNEAFSEKNYLRRNKYGEHIDGIDSMRLLWDIAISAWVKHDKPDKLNGEEELLKRLRIFDQVLQDNLLSRRLLSVGLIPPWLAIGLVTVGILWPPQVREFLFCPSLDNTADKQSKSELLLEKVQKKMKDMLLEVKMNSVSSRIQSLEEETKQISVEMFQTRNDVVKEINSIKELLTAIDKKL